LRAKQLERQHLDFVKTLHRSKIAEEFSGKRVWRDKVKKLDGEMEKVETAEKPSPKSPVSPKRPRTEEKRAKHLI
jgi:hypothetical protein